MSDVEVDATITDPPYSERNHKGYNAYAGKPTSTGGRVRNKDGHEREAIAYAAWKPEDVFAFVKHWSERTRGWMFALTSHDLIPAWEQAYAEAKRYHFAPVPCVIRGMSVRMMGDGPSSWTVYGMAARPRTKAMLKWGTLPGAYVAKRTVEGGAGRGKPGDLMAAIVRDYSRLGDLVGDQHAGYGTTLKACSRMGRQSVGAECETNVYAEALARIGRPVTADLFAEAR